MEGFNSVSQSSTSPIEEPWNYEWIIVGKNKKYGPFSYDKVLKLLEDGKVKTSHKCYSPAGGGEFRIDNLANQKKRAS